MNTLLHTTEGISPMHEIVEEQADWRDIQADKFIRWEALRSLVNTIGAHDALRVALTQPEGGRP